MNKTPCVVFQESNKVLKCGSLDDAKNKCRMALALSRSLLIFYYDDIPEYAKLWDVI